MAAVLSFLLAAAVTARVCDVTHYGAKGDNMTKDTDAIKQAIVSCSAGGVILLPATEPRVYMYVTHFFFDKWSKEYHVIK